MGVPLGPINKDDPAVEILRNLPAKNTNYIIMLVGTKREEHRGGVLLTWYDWRGRSYFAGAEYLGGPCIKCGQVDNGQTGEYPCEVCGLPVVWDDIVP